MSDLHLRYFTQWSQQSDKWYCICCGIQAAGIEDYKEIKGKRKKYLRQDFDSLIHTQDEGDGNRIIHRQGCRFFTDYVAKLPAVSAMVS